MLKNYIQDIPIAFRQAIPIIAGIYIDYQDQGGIKPSWQVSKVCE